MIGKRVAEKYKVLSELGKGGFGSVYLVEIVAGMIGEKLALKVLSKEVSEDKKSRDQFLNEIRLAMKLVDKHIIQLRDVGTTEDGRLYYTMDYSPGETLKEILARDKRLTANRALRLVRYVLKGLRTAHDKGVIHRDLKPGNLMVEREGKKEIVRILDFGIATLEQSESDGKRGRFAGSFLYTPPEQLLGQGMGFYTDTYSVGVILYECLTSQRPYQGKTPQEVYNDIKSRGVVPPDDFNADLKSRAGVVDIVMKALERNPEKRYQTASEFLADIERAILDPTWRREDVVAAAAPVQATPPTPSGAPTTRRRAAARARRSQFPVGGVVAAVVAIAAVVVGFKFINSEGDDSNRGREKPPVVKDDTPPSKPPSKPPEQIARETADAAYVKAQEQRDAGNLEQAIRSCRQSRDAACKFPQLSERCANAQFLKGQLELEAKQFAESVESLTSALEEYKKVDNNVVDRPDLFASLAAALWGAGQQDATVAFLEKWRGESYESARLTVQLMRYLEEARRFEELRKLLLQYEGRIIDIFAGEGKDLDYVQGLFDHHVVTPRLKNEIKSLRARIDTLSRDLEQCMLAFKSEKPEEVTSKGKEVLAAVADLRQENTGELEKRFPEEVEALHASLGKIDERRLVYCMGVSHGMMSEYALGKNHLNRADGMDGSGALSADIKIALGDMHLGEYERALDAGTPPPARNLATAKSYYGDALSLLAGDAEERRAHVLTHRARCFAHAANESSMERDIDDANRIYSKARSDSAIVCHQGKSYYYVAARTRVEKALRAAIRRLQDGINLIERDRSPSKTDERRLGECLMLQGMCYYYLKRDRQDLAKAKTKLIQAKRDYGVETRASRRVLEDIK